MSDQSNLYKDIEVGTTTVPLAIRILLVSFYFKIDQFHDLD